MQSLIKKGPESYEPQLKAALEKFFTTHKDNGSIADLSHAELEFYMTDISASLLGMFSWFMAFSAFPDCGGVATAQILFFYQWG